ncbi:MAG: serine hydrolase domain-containing protein, partial [Sphingobacteriales bacterium]
MKQLLTILCMCLVFSSTAQTAKTILSPATPASAGFSDERLKRIDKKIQDWIDAKLVNGGVAFIAREGKIVYNKSFGYADMEKKIPMRTDHIFRIASQTKAITSLAILILLEEGKLTLDDPVSRYIPEFAKPQVVTKFNLSDTTWTSEPAKREITIKDLITHTSGIGYAQIGTPEAQALYKKYGITAGLGVGGHSLSTDMRKLGKLPLFSNPGEKWTYSLGDDVLGLVVEVISGMNLEQFFRTKIFDPLGMNDTWFYLPKDKHSRLVKLYTHDS